MSNLRPGMVATIRVNPKDCMAVLDVVKAAGLSTDGMSFAAMTSLAFSSLLQTMRDQEVIPDRDGFEYLDMMQPYLGSKNNKKKVAITKTLQNAGSKVRVHGLSKPKVEKAPIQEPPTLGEDKALSIEERLARSELTELCRKRDMAEEGAEGILWSAADQSRYDELLRVVYPE
jgi:hypothetical protein